MWTGPLATLSALGMKWVVKNAKACGGKREKKRRQDE